LILLTLDCTVALCSFINCFLIALFSYSAFKAASVL